MQQIHTIQMPVDHPCISLTDNFIWYWWSPWNILTVYHKLAWMFEIHQGNDINKVIVDKIYNFQTRFFFYHLVSWQLHGVHERALVFNKLLATTSLYVIVTQGSLPVAMIYIYLSISFHVATIKASSNTWHKDKALIQLPFMWNIECPRLHTFHSNIEGWHHISLHISYKSKEMLPNNMHRQCY